MKRFLRLLIALTTLFMAFKLCEYMFFYVETQTALPGSLESAISTYCYLAKNEVVLESPAEGVLEVRYGEGDRVPSGQIVASILSGNFDSQMETKLLRINERITSIQKSQSDMFRDDVARIDAQISDELNKIIDASNQNQLDKVTVINAEINNLLDKKLAITGGEHGTSALLAQLGKEKEQLEAQIGARRVNITAPIAGVFSSAVDGLESVITLDGISAIGVEEFKKLDEMMENPTQKNDASCKIIDNFRWGVVISLPQNSCADIKIDDYLYLRFNEFSEETVAARVVSLSAPVDKKQVVACVLSRYVQGITLNRRASVDVVRSSASGIKLSKSALSMVDNVEGVYVKTTDGMVFKPAKVLAKDDRHIILPEPTDMNSVTLYDQVVIRGQPNKN